jgi:hypothetical protein
MAWTGTWRNQYGSRLTITDESEGRLRGTFRTALVDSGFFGLDVEVAGVHCGACVSFAFAAATPKGDMACAFTGLLRDGRIETMWHVAADRAADGQGPRPWPHAVTVNADTFERAAG